MGPLESPKSPVQIKVIDPFKWQGIDDILNDILIGWVWQINGGEDDAPPI